MALARSRRIGSGLAANRVAAKQPRLKRSGGVRIMSSGTFEQKRAEIAKVLAKAFSPFLVRRKRLAFSLFNGYQVAA